jgi:hypothetical protein
MVHRICTIAEISLGLSVSDLFTAPVTHQDQGHSGKFTPILMKKGSPIEKGHYGDSH